MERQICADNTRIELENQCKEDPRRSPIEKETAFHLVGDGEHFEVTSFRKVVFTKLLQRPAFEIRSLDVMDSDQNRKTVESLNKVASDPSLKIIGVVGRLPVGAITVGNPRTTNSHADVVIDV